ncbi:uncharacterized protein [Dendropsophus ebraccatus]|uniref:uncharacterized protein n=1 Tax=Dendropsophus ebraccatus TaxID=150705 RepID=UPI0038317C2C
MATPPSPSADEAQIMEPARHNLLFEGFLRKRKDTMKFTWAKYWFRLQNTTLYFYTKRDPQPAYLRGQYYMYSVQSVRSVTSPDGDFSFEIVLKNGKRKLLSAESEDLRDVWIKLLWKSMQLPGPGHPNSSCTWYDVPELIQRGLSLSQDDSDCIHTNADDMFGNSPESVLKDGSEEDTSSDSDIYDFPRPVISTSAPSAAAPDAASPALSILPVGDESESKEETSSESDIYDFPRPVILESAPPAAAPDAAPPACSVLPVGDESELVTTGTPDA